MEKKTREQKLERLKALTAELNQNMATLREASDVHNLCMQEAEGLMKQLRLDEYRDGARVIKREKQQERVVLNHGRLKRRYKQVYNDCTRTMRTKPRFYYYEEKTKVEQLKTREVCKRSGSPYGDTRDCTK